MKKYLFIFFCFFIFTNSFCQNYEDKYGKPLIIFIETDPWLMVIGSNVPIFTMYENGKIIYRKKVKNENKYFETQILQSQNTFLESLHVSEKLLKLPDYTEASNSTDQPTNILILNLDIFK